MVVLVGVIVLYAGLITYRLFTGGTQAGNTDDGQQTSFWENMTNAIGLNSRKLKGERDGKINFLLTGVPGEENIGPDLTDSIMYVSVDINKKVVNMFSIPRDLYLQIPGFGYNKINSAYSLGKNYQVAGGGMGLLLDTVEDVVGQNIDYYVKIDFSGFVKVVDALGGIDVVVDEDIYDYLYPDEYDGYKVFSLEAGPQHLDGETALKYVRSRQTTSDFDRSKRQQKVLVAIKEAFLGQGIVGGAKALVQIIDIVSDHLETNLEIWEWERIAKLVRDWDSDINYNVYNFDNSAEGFLVDGSVDGMYILQPYGGDFSQIHDFVDLVISGNNDSIIRSNIDLVVYNATNRVGLAGGFADIMTEKGYNIIMIDNASELREDSVFQCNSEKDIDILEEDLTEWKFSRSKDIVENSNLADCVLVLGNNFEMES